MGERDETPAVFFGQTFGLPFFITENIYSDFGDWQFNLLFNFINDVTTDGNGGGRCR